MPEAIVLPPAISAALDRGDPLSADQRCRAVQELKGQGYSHRAISDMLQIGLATVSRDANADPMDYPVIQPEVIQPEARTRSPIDAHDRVEAIRQLSAEGHRSTQIAALVDLERKGLSMTIYRRERARWKAHA